MGPYGIAGFVDGLVQGRDTRNRWEDRRRRHTMEDARADRLARRFEWEAENQDYLRSERAYETDRRTADDAAFDRAFGATQDARGVLGAIDPSGSGATPKAMAPVPTATSRPAGRSLGDPQAKGLLPHQAALLNGIAVGESGGSYTRRYTPGGGADFEGFDDHPRVFEPGPHGPSSAAGRYQFTATTWDELGGGDFSPATQDRRALQLARQRYGRATERDLDADLQAEGLSDRILDMLAPTWAALGSGRDRIRSAYDDTLSRFRTRSIAPRPAGQSKRWQSLKRFRGA